VSVLCLVPTPLRATRAARRLCDAEGGLLLGARVTTPDALAAIILGAAGDPRPLLTPLAERLLALEAGDAAGGALAGLDPSGGLAGALAGTLQELRRAEVSAAVVRAAATDLGGAAGERLASAARALARWEARLAELGALDVAGAMRAAVATLERGRVPEELRDLDLLVAEGFRALPPASFDLVAALAHRARRTHLRLPYFPERPELSAPVEPLLRRLEALHELAARRDVAVALDQLGDADRAPGLAAALGAVAGGAGRAEGVGDALLFAAGRGEEGEAEVAARFAGTLVERGFAPEEIAVVAASPERAAPQLARAFAAAGIPLATGRGAPLADAPPIRAILDAMATALSPERAEVEGVLGSPYLGLARAPARLGYWLDRAGAMPGRGAPEEALRRRAAALGAPAAAREKAQLLAAAEALAALAAALRPLSAAGLAREHAARLRGFLTVAGVRRRASRAEPELARRDLAAVSRLEERVDDLVRALALLGHAGETLPAARWSALLRAAVEGASIPARPEPAAGAAELWPLAEAPGIGARAAIVVGCRRGAFPASSPADPLLRDGERLALNRAAGRLALRTRAAHRAEALHAAFCALAAGREALALAWAAPGPDSTGGPLAPLAYDLLSSAGHELSEVASSEPDLASARSSREALAAAARLGRGGESEGALTALRSASAELSARAASALARGELERARLEAVLARRADLTSGALPSGLLAAWLQALPEEWTPSQLESHARCPYQLFAGMGLRLAEPELAELDIDPRDEGSLVHAVLERFLRDRLAHAALPLRDTPDERARLARVAEELFASFASDGRAGDPALWAGRRAAVRARLGRVLSAEAATGGEAVPALLEYRFGGDSGVPPLVLGRGEGEVRLRGRLDRVDASADRLVLIDYKNSGSPAWKKKLAPEALGETNFQLPTYLLAAARALPGRSRLEATYLLLRSAERLSPWTTEPGDPFLASGPGAGDGFGAAGGGVPSFAEAAAAAVASIRRGELPVASRDCKGCSFGAVCRAERLAEDAP